jgi:hypothetical protein
MGEEGMAGIDAPPNASDEEVARLKRLFPEAIIFQAGTRR